MKVSDVKMKECCMALFLLSAGLFKSQTIEIRDSIDKEPIKYAELKIKGNIFYSDSLGKFDFNNIKVEENIEIQKWGYRKILTNIDKITSSKTIYLSPIFKNIDEVTIVKKNIFEYKKDIKKSNTTDFPKGLEITSFIENTEQKEATVYYVKIPLKSIMDSKGFIVINFYKKEGGGLPSSVPLNKTPIIAPVNSISRKDDKIYLLNEKITFPVDGIFIGVRIMTNVGEYEPTVSLPVISFYNSRKENIFFRSGIEKWNSFKKEQPSVGFTIGVSR